jgi:hypothetical protein
MWASNKKQENMEWNRIEPNQTSFEYTSGEGSKIN